MIEYSIDYFCTSHIGKLRSINQDNFMCNGIYMKPSDSSDSLENNMISDKTSSAVSPVFGIFDGMGGEECGEVASYLAADCMEGYSFSGNKSQGLRDYCRKANNAICTYMDDHEIASMGTTAAILLFDKKKIYLCNIGDSKIFRLSHGKMRQISYDHVGVAMYGSKPPLMQNLGIRETEMVIEPFVDCRAYREGDIYLICSDGLTDMVDTEEMRTTLLNSEKDSAAAALLEKALENGGKDNITIILLYVGRNNHNNSVRQILERLIGKIRKDESKQPKESGR